MNLIEQQEKEFISRHIGPNQLEEKEMLKITGEKNLDDLVNKTVPSNIKNKENMKLPTPMSEAAYLEHIQEVGQKNIVAKNFIGQGYYGTHTPSVILRNIFENPGWYTQYTPYQ
ncbi:MAG: glycine dehydrogenase (aminomethyl-transferring), partial [Chitinophagia bacterium]|nr:glycine dehydrogenase (aminomethyl-transferring) [Chitinophagia bacterium]